MLKEIILRDFFSFKGEHHIKLSKGVNILLGINGSGMTSFMHALEFLYEGVCGKGLKKLFAEWGGISQVINFSGEGQGNLFSIAFVFDVNRLNQANHNFHFTGDVTYKVTVVNSGSTSYYVSEQLWEGECIHNREIMNYENGQGKIAISSTPPPDHRKDQTFDPQELVLRQIQDIYSFEFVDILRKTINELRIYESFDLRAGSMLRKPVTYSDSANLYPDGTNYANIISEIKDKDPVVYNRLNKDLSNVNHRYEVIDVSFYAGNIIPILRENKLSKNVMVQHISDGTLQYILLLCIFRNRQRGRLIAIDEPERGLHPDMVKSVADMLKETSDTSQYIIATHSALLLNHFSLDDVIVFEKNKDNGSIVSYPDGEDFDDSDLLPGQLWLMGKIGGTRW